MVMRDNYFLYKFSVIISNDTHIITTNDIRKCFVFITPF